MGLDLGEIGGEEPPVGADGVAAQGHGARFGDVRPDEVQRGPARLVERDGRSFDGGEETACAVHGADELVHACEHLGRLVHDEVGALSHHREVVVGDERCNLDDDVVGGIEARHLEVHPHEHAVDRRVRLVGGTEADQIDTARNVVETEVVVVRLDPELALPSYARAGDAGADLVAREPVTLAPRGGRALVPTGVALALPDGYAGFVLPRSGLALRHG